MHYDYSGKFILSVIDYLEKINKEITCVKALKRGKVGHWIAASGRLEGSLYRDDKATSQKGIGIKTLEQLTVGGASTVGHVKALNDEKIQAMALAPGSKLNAKKMTAWHEEAQASIEEDAPAGEDFRKAANPYKARYGEAKWEDEIKKCYFMTPFVCVTDMIEQIMR